MKQEQKQKKFILSLLRNNIIKFLAGSIGLLILLQLAGSVKLEFLVILFKFIGYSFYYYLATPFLIYWLAYVSLAKLTRLKLGITISFMALYSYVLWDSYFFFKETLGFLLFSNQFDSW